MAETITRPFAPTILAAALLAGAGQLSAQTLYDTGETRPRLEVPRDNAPAMDGVPDFDALGTRVRMAADAGKLKENLSQPLSNACATDRFNQRKRGRYHITLDLPSGERKRFGFAGSNGMNLRDPNNLKGPNQGYLFDLDGTSECRVYVFPVTW
ncbi:hypothetical protein KAJ83_11460 [Marivibrio halodurans]|uniref:Uncharacterized protein n=1 Tax=Marivibrio halodurans TaxID=2039722 RepID=A0A8J7SMU8_9PROT|nr:hypothetical protein [Marivibrio halodurans]MBP5857628.1 hypothetical protein [Marivibrio halodurans]